MSHEIIVLSVKGGWGDCSANNNRMQIFSHIIPLAVSTVRDSPFAQHHNITRTDDKEADATVE